MLKAKMSSYVAESFHNILDHFYEVSSLNGSPVHHYLAVVFDPMYKDLNHTLMRLHYKIPEHARAIAGQHDENIILPLLLSSRTVKKTYMSSTININSEPGGHLFDELEGCFTAADDDAEKSARDAMKSKLRTYRSEPFRDGIDEYEWLLGK